MQAAGQRFLEQRDKHGGGFLDRPRVPDGRGVRLPLRHDVGHAVHQGIQPLAAARARSHHRNAQIFRQLL